MSWDFYFMEVDMDNDARIKLLEENISWMQKDIAHLCDIIENLQKPEIHYHITYDMRSCNDCQQTDLKDFS